VIAYLLKDGRLLIPMAAVEDGRIGDGMIPVEKGSAEYSAWLPYAIPAPEYVEKLLNQPSEVAK